MVWIRFIIRPNRTNVLFKALANQNVENLKPWRRTHRCFTESKKNTKPVLMAFTWCVRRSASRLASLCSTRMVRLRSISAVASRPSLAPTPSPFRPFALYSTAIDRMSSEQSLLRVIDSEINTALQIDDPDLVKFTHFAWFVIKGIRKFAVLCFVRVSIWTVLEWITLYSAFAFEAYWKVLDFIKL